MHVTKQVMHCILSKAFCTIYYSIIIFCSAIRTRTHCHGGLVFKLVEKAIAANEERKHTKVPGRSRDCMAIILCSLRQCGELSSQGTAFVTLTARSSPCSKWSSNCESLSCSCTRCLARPAAVEPQRCCTYPMTACSTLSHTSTTQGMCWVLAWLTCKYCTHVSVG